MVQEASSGSPQAVLLNQGHPSVLSGAQLQPVFMILEEEPLNEQTLLNTLSNVLWERWWDNFTWDFALTFAVNACGGLGFKYCQYYGFFSIYFPYFPAVFIFHTGQHGCSPRRGVVCWSDPPPARPPLNRRSVERECDFSWEWAVTPAGQ